MYLSFSPSDLFEHQNMFVKFQLSDTTCLHLFNSTKTSTTPNVGISVTPRTKDPTRRNQQKHTLEYPPSGKNVIWKNPRGRNGIDESSRVGFRAKVIGVLNRKEDKREDRVEDGLSGNPDEKNESFDVTVRSGRRVNGVVEEFRSGGSSRTCVQDGACSEENATASVCLESPDEKIGNDTRFEDSDVGVSGVNVAGNDRGNGASRRVKADKKGPVNKTFCRTNGVKTKCSTKWKRYGGSIPSMLQALETIHDLDEALKPWEGTMTNKERSILLKEQSSWERASEIFEWFKEKGCYEVNVIHYNIMLRILGRAHQWLGLERLCREMEDRKIALVNSTYGTLIDVYSKGGRRDRAIEWLELMNERKMEPDEVTMGIVVQMYKKAGDFKTAEEFFKKWSRGKKDHGSEIPGRKAEDVCLSAFTYNNLIDTYGKAGKLKQASETFDSMLKRGVIPTTVTFNTMIHMYGNNNQLDKIASLMQKMEDAKCSPDGRTYSILISLHAKHGDIELAAEYLKKMKGASIEPDDVSYRTLLHAYSVRNMVDEVEKLIAEMDEKGLEIDEYTQSSVTRMYVQAGLLEKSWSWFARFHLKGDMTSQCYSANIDAFGERGHASLAQRAFDCCKETKKLTALEFNVMVKAYGISKDYERACCLFDSMERYGLNPDRCGYNSLVQMLAGVDLPEKAIFYLRKMQESGFVSDCVPYCAVISSYVKLGQIDKAVDLYEEMVSRDVKPDVIVYGVLINAFAETGNVTEALRYVNAMRNSGLPMNVVVCKSLIKLYTKAGYLKEARESYEALGPEPDAYASNCMIDLYSERSMVPEAEEVFRRLKRSGAANEFAYAMMVCMYRRNGNFVEAFRIAREMRERLGPMKDRLSYNNVLGLYASDGRYKEAAATFKEMVESRVGPDDSTFKALGVVLLKCGVSKGGVERLERVRREDYERGVREWVSTVSSVVDVDSGG